jgi:hypothetical protein
MKKIFCTCFILLLSYYSISYAQSTMTPDGSYVGGDSYTMTPDGSYVGGDSYTMTPDGSYVGGDSYTMTPDGSYVGSDRYSSTPYGSSESTNDIFGQNWNNFGQ